MADRPSPSPPRPTETNPTPEAQARARALRLLARRERTRRGVERALYRAGYPRSIVVPLLDELERRGLLSDLRYCRLYLGEQTRTRPRSLRLLRRDLRRAGADRQAIERACEEAGPELSDEELVRAAARKKLRTAGDDPARLSRLLQARGFSAGLVRRALRELLGADPGGGRQRAAARRPAGAGGTDGPAGGTDPAIDGTKEA